MPRMLIAITRKPLSASISRIVRTVSYRIELPTFLEESVFVATYEWSETRNYAENCDAPALEYHS